MVKKDGLGEELISTYLALLAFNNGTETPRRQRLSPLWLTPAFGCNKSTCIISLSTCLEELYIFTFNKT